MRKIENNLKKYYDVLEIEPGARLDQIKEAYRLMAQIWHPDRFVNQPTLLQKCHTHMQEINEAYKKLTDYIVFQNRVDAKQNYEMGLRQYKSGQYEPAIGSFATALYFDPDYADAYYWSGLAHEKIRLYERGIALLRKADELTPNNPKILLAMADNYAGSGLLRNAIRYYTQVLSHDPTNLEALGKCATCAQEIGDWNTATSACLTAIQIDQKNWNTHIALAKLYRQQGCLAEALNRLDVAQHLCEDNAARHSYTTNLMIDITEERELLQRPA